MVQVRLMVLPGFTNTEDSAWMTAVAAREREREVGRDQKRQKLTENVEPEAEVYLGLRVDLTLVVTFVCHSEYQMVSVAPVCYY